MNNPNPTIPILLKREINEIILHCSATAEGKDYTVEDIRSWHTSKGWSDIGYHYVIYRDGSIHTGRPLDRSGAHVKNRNAHSIGICYIGGVEAQRDSRGKWPAKNTMTPQQRQAVVHLVNKLRDDFGDLDFTGHNEYAAKACPSFKVSEEFPNLYKKS